MKYLPLLPAPLALSAPIALIAPIALMALVSSGCSGLQAEAMVPDGIQIGDPHPGSVRVDAQGMKPVGGDALAAAVSSALTAAHLFESVVEPGADECDWVLAVTVKNVERDGAALSMTSKAIFDWTLKAESAEHPTWSKTIATEYTATPDDTKWMEERGRIATTRAVQENIQRALVAMGQLELD